MITLNDLCQFATKNGIPTTAPLAVSNLTTSCDVTGILSHPDGKLRVCIETNAERENAELRAIARELLTHVNNTFERGRYRARLDGIIHR